MENTEIEIHQNGKAEVEKINTSLLRKIQLVSNEIKNLEKDMTVGTGSYAYKAVGDQQVILAVKEAETKHGLISIPFKQELINSEIIRTVKKNGDEGLTFVDTIKMQVRITDLETGDFIDVDSFGKGIDSNDKGFGKASTYARKYALLNAYKIATGEDPDAVKSEETTTPKTVDDKKKMVFDYLHANDQVLVQMLQHFSVQELDDLNEKQINTIYATYKKKGLI